MNRPIHIWLIFSACAGVVLAALGWVTRIALRLDQAEQRANAQAGLEGHVRLALWRMDSAVAPFITEESARPHFVYQAFHEPDRAYTKGYAAVAKGDVLIPSPLSGVNVPDPSLCASACRGVVAP